MDQETQIRYSRQINLPTFSIENQTKLSQSRVLVVGAGGLGSPLVYYLAASGIGHLGIIDFDQVEIHNLHRQILFTSADLGKSKAQLAGKKALAINPNIDCQIYEEKLSCANVEVIFKDYDLIVDGTDNFPTRYLVNDACVKLGKINVFGSILRFEGQVAVFNHPIKDGSRSPNYRDLYPIPPNENTIPNCAEAGVLGPAVGTIASIQALEAIKIAAGMNSSLIGKMLSIDLQDYHFHTLKFKERTDHIFRSENSENILLEDYENLCKIKTDEKIDLDSFQIIAKIKNDKSIRFIDIREEFEYEYQNIGVENIPREQFISAFEKLDKNVTYVFHCQSGARTRALINQLKEQYPSLDLFHLAGGIEQWKKEQGPGVKFSEI